MNGPMLSPVDDCTHLFPMLIIRFTSVERV